MSTYREESRFRVAIELSAEFDDAYNGDEDGYAWLERWRAATHPRLMRAVFDALRADPEFEAVPSPRGASPDEEIEIAVHFKPGRSHR